MIKKVTSQKQMKKINIIADEMWEKEKRLRKLFFNNNNVPFRFDDNADYYLIENDAGFIGVIRSEPKEIFYAMAKKHRRAGLMTKALQSLLPKLQFKMPIVAMPYKENIASRRVLEKCGFKLKEERRFGQVTYEYEV